jgi:PncC family amidohydrolase
VREDAAGGHTTLETLEGLAVRLQDACLDRGLWVASAESCTGGLVAHAITQVPGSSGYLRGSIVAYANEAKTDVLGVDGSLIAAHGAVSAQVARAMAVAARERFGCDVAVSTTGVAGPGGGSDEKPVGLTYLAVADAHGVEVVRQRWDLDRTGNKLESARAALELLLRRVERTPVPAGSGAGPVPHAGATTGS